MQQDYKKLVFYFFIVLVSVFCVGCGYTSEQITQMNSIEEFAEVNAVKYIQSKYGFDAEVEDCVHETPSDEGLFGGSQDPTGKAIVTMKYKGDVFTVYINGMGDDFEFCSYDNYQYLEICEKIKDLFDCYDIQLKYGYSVNSDDLTGLIHEYFDGDNFKEVLGESMSSEAEFVYVDKSVKDFDTEKAHDFGIMNGIALNFVSRGTYNSINKKDWILENNNQYDIGNNSILINDYKTFYSYKDVDYIRSSKKEHDGLIFDTSNLSVLDMKDFDLGSLKDIYTVVGGTYKVITGEDEITIFVPSKKVNTISRPYLVYSYCDKDGNYFYSACKLDATLNSDYLTASIHTGNRNNIKISLAKGVDKE